MTGGRQPADRHHKTVTLHCQAGKECSSVRCMWVLGICHTKSPAQLCYGTQLDVALLQRLEVAFRQQGTIDLQTVIISQLSSMFSFKEYTCGKGQSISKGHSKRPQGLPQRACRVCLQHSNFGVSFDLVRANSRLTNMLPFNQALHAWVQS